MSSVEPDRVVIDGVDYDQSRRRSFPGGNRLAQGLGEQQRASAWPLMSAAHGEASQQHHADRVGGEAANQFGGRVLAQDRSHSETEVPHHSAVRAHKHEYPGRIHLLCCKRMTPQPRVEELVTRVETIKLVSGLEASESKARSSHSSASLG
jgi:hypothetical protein